MNLRITTHWFHRRSRPKGDLNSAITHLVLLTAFMGCGVEPIWGQSAEQEANNIDKGANEIGKIVRVTLFRDQALVTREIKVDASNEEREISVGRLPERVVVESIYAEGGEAIDVRSVRVTQRAVRNSDQSEVRDLNLQAEKLQQQYQQKSLELELLAKEVAYIDKLMDFSLQASHSDRNAGVLDAKSLVEVTDYSMEKQAELHASKRSQQQELEALKKQMEELQQRSRLLTQPTGTQYEVRLLVANPDPNQAGVVELSYLVSGCKWSPQYTIRGQIESQDFGMRYSALVEQMSGEDWQNVQLTLSTASPSMGAAGPSLTPFRVAVGNAGLQQAAQAGEDMFGGNDPFMGGMGGGGGFGGPSDSAMGLQARTKSLKQKQQAVANEYAGKHSQVDNLTRDFALNAVASEVQNLELEADAKQLKTLASDADDDVASQTYQLEQRVSLDSRREQQLVSIIDTQLAGSLYHVATPLLSSFAYREADIVNDQSVGLLRGPATIYLDGRFVGRTELPSIASGQHLIVGFGADNQVRTRRELMEKRDEVQGGNRRLTFQYRLVVANFKSDPVRLRLYDRLPLANQTDQISVKQLDFQLPISEDGLYARMQKPRGILRWDLNVPGEQFGEKAFDVEYGYSVEFDRNRQLTAIISEDQIASDYQEIGAPSSMSGMGGGMGGMGGGSN